MDGLFRLQRLQQTALPLVVFPVERRAHKRTKTALGRLTCWLQKQLKSISPNIQLPAFGFLLLLP